MDVKEFLKQPHIQKLLVEEDMDKIFKQWIFTTVGNARLLKKFFEDAGIDPLEYMAVVPTSYCYYESPNIVRIPSNIIKIDKLAFYKCNNLDKVYIPKSVNIIRTKAFYECFYLNSVEYEGTMKEFKSISCGDSFTYPVSIICSDGTIEHDGIQN